MVGREQRSMERCSRCGDGPTRPGISQKKKRKKRNLIFKTDKGNDENGSNINIIYLYNIYICLNIICSLWIDIIDNKIMIVTLNLR